VGAVLPRVSAHQTAVEAVATSEWIQFLGVLYRCGVMSLHLRPKKTAVEAVATSELIQFLGVLYRCGVMSLHLRPVAVYMLLCHFAERQQKRLIAE
jgi:hypothetical protein